MACEVEDMHDALIGLSFDHIDPIFTAIEASVFWRSTISAIVHSTEASAICLVGTYGKNGFFVWKSALFAVELSLARIKHPGGCQFVATTKAGQKTESLTSEQRGHQGRLN
jgi:hypothetical protein